MFIVEVARVRQSCLERIALHTLPFSIEACKEFPTLTEATAEVCFAFLTLSKSYLLGVQAASRLGEPAEEDPYLVLTEARLLENVSVLERGMGEVRQSRLVCLS